MKIVDTHSHLWLRQDTSWNGKPIRSLRNGRSIFLGEEVQMIPPFIINGENSAEVFLSNMDYAQVAAAVVVQEYPDRFITCGMCDYFAQDLVRQAGELIAKGFKGIAIPGHRLIQDDVRIMLNSPEILKMFKLMEEKDVFLSITLADGDEQVPEMKDVISECPDLRIAIGHFGMPTRENWLEQVKLAENKNVFVESGGITWLYNSEFYPFDGAVRAIREAADAVGMEKLMWGSDYPRTITAITYRMSYDFILKSKELSQEEKSMFLGENACRFYRLENLIDLPYIKNMSE